MTGKKFIDLIILSLCIITTAVVVFLFFQGKRVIFNRMGPDDTIESKALTANSKALMIPETYQIKRVVVNLRSRTKRLRFLEISLHLTLLRAEYIEKLDSFNHIIQDTIIRTASHLYPDELESITGKILFEQKLKEALNKALEKHFKTDKIFQEIYFSKFIVQ